MDKRLEKMFRESRERHNKKEQTEEDLKLKRAQNMMTSYVYNDKQKGYNNTVDFDKHWMVENILDQECAYCGESDWHKLGCDRINNNKPHTKDNVIPCCKRCNIIRSNKFTVDEMKEIGAVIKRIENRHPERYWKKTGKRVGKYDGDVLIKEYECGKQVLEDGYNPWNVRKACRGEQKQYDGFIWKYL